MTMFDAINEINSALNRGDHAWAQCIVMEVESHGSILPSAYFEHVLKAAIRADALLPVYADWCRRAYGKSVYDQMIATF